MDRSKPALKSLPDHIKQNHINCLAIIPKNTAQTIAAKMKMPRLGTGPM